MENLENKLENNNSNVNGNLSKSKKKVQSTNNRLETGIVHKLNVEMGQIWGKYTLINTIEKR